MQTIKNIIPGVSSLVLTCSIFLIASLASASSFKELRIKLDFESSGSMVYSITKPKNESYVDPTDPMAVWINALAKKEGKIQRTTINVHEYSKIPANFAQIKKSPLDMNILIMLEDYDVPRSCEVTEQAFPFLSFANLHETPRAFQMINLWELEKVVRENGLEIARNKYSEFINKFKFEISIVLNE